MMVIMYIIVSILFLFTEYVFLFWNEILGCGLTLGSEWFFFLDNIMFNLFDTPCIINQTHHSNVGQI